MVTTKPHDCRSASDSELFWEAHVPKMLAAGRDTTLRGVSAVALFDITGPGGGQWTVTIDDGTIETVSPGVTDDPTIRITLEEGVFAGIARGELDHHECFFQGKIQIDGDMPLVLWLANLIPFLREKFPFEPESLREDIG